MDPLLFGMATNLATDVLKAGYTRIRDFDLGDAETRALRQAFTRALGELAAEVARELQDELTPELVSLVEEQLRRIVVDATIAELLVSAALEERGPDPARLRRRFEELGFDPRTFLTDFDAAMTRFRYALADQLLREAGAAGSPLFNRVVLAQLSLVRDQLSGLGQQSRAAQPKQPTGRPVREWADPFALEVHSAIDPSDHADVLPRYVPRTHDEELARVVDRAKGGRSAFLVLVGGSSTGKTRACWEAVQALPDSWRLWHPLSPGRVDALVDGLAEVGPQTVIWLNDLHHYMLDATSGERIAAKLRELLRAPDSMPVLVLATTWPEYWHRLTPLPQPGQPDLRPQTRSLLAGSALVVPEAFTASDLERAGEAARSDSRLRDALGHSTDGEITQYLAGAPALLERFQTAPPTARAVIEAAMDSRRLGHGLELSEELLRQAAPGYLNDGQRESLAADWFAEAVAYTEMPCRGVSGPVVARRNEASAPTYRLADYLDQWARQARIALLVPASTWDALEKHSAERDLPAIAKEADERHLYRRSFELYLPAAEAGDANALLIVAHYLAVVGMVDEALDAYGQAADTGATLALQSGAQALADLGLVDRSLTWWRMAADAGSNPHYMGICAARCLARAGRLDEALEWWERAADQDAEELVWYTSNLRYRSWENHRIPRGVFDWTVLLPFNNTGAQLALLDAARALHRAGRLTEAMNWYERAADLDRSHALTWYRRRGSESDEVHKTADWMAKKINRRPGGGLPEPAKVFHDVARDGRVKAVIQGAQALAEAGLTAETMQWLFDHVDDENEAVRVASKIFQVAGQEDRAAEWIEQDDSDLASRIRTHPWQDAFAEARIEFRRTGNPDFVGLVGDTFGTFGGELFDVLEPRGAALDTEQLDEKFGNVYAEPSNVDLAGPKMNAELGALVAAARQHRLAGRIDEAVKAYLRSAECGGAGFSAAVELLRKAGRGDNAERLARFGLEPGGVIGYHPAGDVEPPAAETDEAEHIVSALLRRWRLGGNVFGSAVLRAAIDVLRCGYRGLLTSELIGAVADVALADLGIPPMTPEQLGAALTWAAGLVVDENAPIRPDDSGGYQVLGPLLEAVKADPGCPPVPESAWLVVCEHAPPESCWSVAGTARERGLADIAEVAARRGAEAGDTLAMFILASVLDEAGRGEEADHLVSSAAEAGEPNALRVLGDRAAAQGQTEKAIELYRRTDHWSARLHLGTLLYREGRSEDAAAVLHEALADGPPVIAHNLGVVLWALNRPAEAEPYFARAAAAGYLPARAELARVLVSLARTYEAEQAYMFAIDEGATELAPEYGELLEKEDRGGEALRLYRRMVDAGEFSVVHQLAEHLELQGKTNLAVDLIRSGADAGHGYSMNRLALLLDARGDLDQAEPLYREAIAAGFEAAQNNLALLLRRRGDDVEAENLLRAAVADGDPNATNNLGVLLLDQGRLEEAETYLLRAMTAGDVGAVNNLGLLRQKRGQRAEAERLFRLAADAGDRKAPGNLARLLSEDEPAPDADGAAP